LQYLLVDVAYGEEIKSEDCLGDIIEKIEHWIGEERESAECLGE
jgi:hypothetical protein